MVAAAIGAVGAVAGAASSIAGASKGAAGSQQAADAQAAMYQQTRADLAPYTQAGVNNLGNLQTFANSGPYGPGGTNYLAMAEGQLPGQMTQAELEATPGYQFTRTQGLQAVQNAAAARGLGVSGAALRGAADYATGLANSTYKDQFAIQQQRFGNLVNLNQTQQGNVTNQWGRLYDVAKLGEAAGAATGVAGTALAGKEGNFLQTGGQSSGAGIAGVGNAIGGGLQNYLGSRQLEQLTGGAGTGGYGSGFVDNTSTF